MKNGIKCTWIYPLQIVQVNLSPLFDRTADYPAEKNATDFICRNLRKALLVVSQQLYQLIRSPKLRKMDLKAGRVRAAGVLEGTQSPGWFGSAQMELGKGCDRRHHRDGCWEQAGTVDVKGKDGTRTDGCGLSRNTAGQPEVPPGTAAELLTERSSGGQKLTSSGQILSCFWKKRKKKSHAAHDLMTQQSLSGLLSCVLFYTISDFFLFFSRPPRCCLQRMHAETGNPCGLHRGEEGEFSNPGLWARPGDVDSSSHREQFGARSVWGLLKP